MFGRTGWEQRPPPPPPPPPPSSHSTHPPLRPSQPGAPLSLAKQANEVCRGLGQGGGGSVKWQSLKLTIGLQYWVRITTVMILFPIPNLPCALEPRTSLTFPIVKVTALCQIIWMLLTFTLPSCSHLRFPDISPPCLLSSSLLSKLDQLGVSQSHLCWQTHRGWSMGLCPCNTSFGCGLRQDTEHVGPSASSSGRGHNHPHGRLLGQCYELMSRGRVAHGAKGALHGGQLLSTSQLLPSDKRAREGQRCPGMTSGNCRLPLSPAPAPKERGSSKFSLLLADEEACPRL